MGETKKSVSRTAQTYKRIRYAIISAEIFPGERLKIDELCKRFDASSGAIREALSRLSSDGLVLAEPQKGFVVAPIARRDLIELSEVRSVIEMRCLEQSIRNGGVAWEVAVLSARHELNAVSHARILPETGEYKDYYLRHQKFHDALVSACPNACWLEIRSLLYLRSERYRRIAMPVDETGRSVEKEHNEIADLALAHDVDGAVAAIERHIQNTTDMMLRANLPELASE